MYTYYFNLAEIFIHKWRHHIAEGCAVAKAAKDSDMVQILPGAT